MNKHPHVKILCAPTGSLPELSLLKENVVLRSVQAATVYAKLHRNWSWQWRDEVEEDQEWRQIIPYTVITNINTGRTVLLRRTSQQAEARLHDKYSVGVGGHIEEEDLRSAQPNSTLLGLIETAALREITEETGLLTWPLTFQGIIGVFDPQAEAVSLVHLGILFHAFTTDTEFKGEEEKHERSWATPADLLAHYERMELWSQLVVAGYLTR